MSDWTGNSLRTGSTPGSTDGALLAFPFTEPGRWRLTAALSPAELADGGFVEDSLDQFTRLYRRRTGDTTSEIADMSGFSVYRVNQRVVDQYRRGRVVLIGDAAHVHTPAGGLGMNTGIQDAYGLGWRLGAVIAGAGEGLVDDFERERRPVAEALLSSTGGLQRLYSIRDHRIQRARDLALRALLDLAPLRRAFFRRAGQLDITYRTGRPTLHRGADVGDRSPDGPSLLADGTPTRLHDHLRGPSPALLVFSGSQPSRGGAGVTILVDRATALDVRVVHVVAGTGLDVSDTVRNGVVLLDRDGELHRRYGATTSTVVVVRPDGHIALRGRPRDADPVMDALCWLTGSCCSASVSSWPSRQAPSSSSTGSLPIDGRWPARSTTSPERSADRWAVR